jgi:hypothetical protein
MRKEITLKKTLLLLALLCLIPWAWGCATPIQSKKETRLAQADKKKPDYQSTYQSKRTLEMETPDWEDVFEEEETPPSTPQTEKVQDQTAPQETPPKKEAQEDAPQAEEKKEEPAVEAPPEDPGDKLEESPWEEDFVRDMQGIKKAKQDRSSLTGDLVGTFPLADEIQLGEGVAARTLDSMPELNNQALWEYVSFIGLSLEEHSLRSDLASYFIVLDDPEEINAFAAPGGFIFITSGAVRFCRNEAELASILAHELGHIGYRHGIQRLDLSKYRLMSQGMVMEMDDAFGKSEFFDLEKSMDPRLKEVENALSEIADQCFDQMLNPYGQKMEFEADSESLRMLSQAGYNPYAAVTVLERLRQQTGDIPAYEKALHSHPPTSERIASLKEKLKKLGLKNEGALNQKRFEAYTQGL